jgi:hypothetical protein
VRVRRHGERYAIRADLRLALTPKRSENLASIGGRLSRKTQCFRPAHPSDGTNLKRTIPASMPLIREKWRRTFQSDILARTHRKVLGRVSLSAEDCGLARKARNVRVRRAI